VRSTKFLAVAAGLAALTFVAFGCGSDDDDADVSTPAGSRATQPAAGSDYSNLSGSVVVDGSSTVGPITEAMAEEFGKVSKVNVSVGISGTGGGFEKFCKGETDINDASRAIKDSENEACTASGVEAIEFKVGVDGLTVAVNSENTWATCLTWSQLRKIWDQGSTVQNWSDIDPSYPDEGIKLFGPGADSGTFDYFTEEINGKVDQSRSDYTASEDDNVLVQGVQNDKYAMAYFGYAYFQEAGEEQAAVQVDKDQDNKGVAVPAENRKGCLSPSEATILDNSYSLSRPLYIYVAREALARPEVRGFVEFYLTNPELVSDVGYVQLPAADYEEGLTTLKAN
jgi:phosphate transport system substrate-binding protein